VSDPDEILLQSLLRQRNWHRYGMFTAAYDKAARTVDPQLVGSYPSRAQHHRWMTGELKRLPYTHHCQVLEAMFPDWTIEQLFAVCASDSPADGPAMSNPLDAVNGMSTAEGAAPPTIAQGYADVAAIFASRAEFSYRFPPHELFDSATEIRTAGLSLNLLCQQYPDQKLRRLVKNGARLQCLFLDPDGEAIRAREQEEGYTDRHLMTLTKLNIEVLTRIRDRLPEDARQRFGIAVYDETVRFNITLLDGTTCIMQPYLPQARGVDSPTFLIRNDPARPGLFDTFEEIFSSLWERSRPV
jgi:Domain of unknown function (DUF5919)